jgi:spore coat protein U-like protein
MSWHRALIALVLGALLPLVSSAQSGIACGTQMSPGVLAFGNYSPLAPGGIAMLLGEVVVTCTNTRTNPTENVKVRSAISAGSSGSVAQRQMVSGSSPVPLLYNLYQDGSYTNLWTDSLGGSGVELNVPRGGTAQLRLPVFGRVPANQSGARPGSYVDALVLTVRY